MTGVHNRSDLRAEIARDAVAQQDEASGCSQQPVVNEVAGERLELKEGDAVSIRRRQQPWQRRRRNHVRVLPQVQVASEDHGAQVEPSREGSVAQGALAQAVQEHREWVKFRNMTQELEHGPVLAQKEGLLPYSHYLSPLVPTLDS